MQKLPNDTQLQYARDQLLLKCIQQLIQDSTDTENINYLKRSAQSLSELFENRKIYIFAIDEEVANKDLNVSLFLIDKPNQETTLHYRIKIEQEDIKSHKLLSITESEKFNSTQELNRIFNIDFGEQLTVIHSLWLKGKVVGGFGYEPTESKTSPEHVAPVLDMLQNILYQRKKHIEFEEKIRTYKHVLDLIPQRVFWKNKKSVYLGANAAFAEDAGLNEASKIVGTNDFDLFPEEANIYRNDDQKTIKTKEHLINMEEPQTTKSGKTIWLKTSKRPMINKQDEVIGLLGTYDEITELKNIQLELQDSKDKLEERVKERIKDLGLSNQKLENTLAELKQTQTHLIETEKMAALGNLVAGISHEINTPIGVSVTAASYIQETIDKLEAAFTSGELTEEHFNNFCSITKDSANILTDNLASASRLIKNFKQIAVDQTNDVPRKVRLKSYVTTILSSLSPVFRNKKIELIIDIDSEFEFIIFPGAFTQVVTNFTENAIKHAFPDDNTVGYFKISCDSTPTHMNFRFCDNGVGIPKSLQKKIFEPFFTTKQKSGGSGLGLSIIYNIINQQFNGKIVCNSELDKGTEFHMSVPHKLNRM